MSTITANNVTRVDGKPVLGWTLLSTTVASSDSTIDIINLSSDYFMYKFIWYGVEPSTDNIDFSARTSSDNGGDWDNATDDYEWCEHRISMNPTEAHVLRGKTEDAEFEFLDNQGSGSNEKGDFEITLFNPSDTEFTKFKWEGIYFRSIDSRWQHIISGGARVEAGVVNGVRFFYETGNIDTGTLKVYGVRA